MQWLVFLTFISSLSKHTRESCLDYRQQLTNLVGQNSLQSTENADAPLLVGAPIFLDSVQLLEASISDPLIVDFFGLISTTTSIRMPT